MFPSKMRHYIAIEAVHLCIANVIDGVRAHVVCVRDHESDNRYRPFDNCALPNTCI